MTPRETRLLGLVVDRVDAIADGRPALPLSMEPGASEEVGAAFTIRLPVNSGGGDCPAEEP